MSETIDYEKAKEKTNKNLWCNDREILDFILAAIIDHEERIRKLEE